VFWQPYEVWRLKFKWNTAHVATSSPDVSFHGSNEGTTVLHCDTSVISVARWWSRTRGELNRLIIQAGDDAINPRVAARASQGTCHLTAKITPSRLLFAPIETSSSSSSAPAAAPPTSAASKGSNLVRYYNWHSSAVHRSEFALATTLRWRRGRHKPQLSDLDFDGMRNSV